MKTAVAMLALLLAGLLPVAPLGQDEPPDDNIVQEVEKQFSEDERYSQVSGGIGKQVMELATMGAEVESVRLERSGATLYKVTWEMDNVDASGSRQVTSYVEVRSVQLSSGKTVWIKRPLTRAESERMIAEEQGLAAGEFAAGLREGAKGAVGIGVMMESALAGISLGAKGKGGGASLAEQFEGLTGTFVPGSGRCTESYAEDLEGGGTPPWLSVSPAAMMMGNACFLLFAADAFDTARAPADAEKKAAAAAYLAHMEEALKEMRYLGKGEVRGHPTHGIRTEKPGIPPVSEGGQTTEITAMETHVDQETYVKRKQRLEGKVSQKGKSQGFVMEKIWDDYRNVPNSTLYEPYLEIISIGGVMDPKQQKALKKAEAELADYETQLAQLPPSQQAMMKKMIEPKLQKLRSMAGGGGFEMKAITTEIEVNPDLASREFNGGPGTAPTARPIQGR